MLLVDELISEGQAEASTGAQAEVQQAERTWDMTTAASADVFEQGREPIEDGVAPGSVAPAQAEEPRTVLALAPA